MIVIDVETTGLNPYKHSIISLGAVILKKNPETFYEECRPYDGAEITQKALEINGFTKDYIMNVNRSLKELCLDFLEWSSHTRNKTLAGHNISFDSNFLKHSFGLNGIEWHFGYHYLDLHSIAYAEFLKKGVKIPTRKGVSVLGLDTILKEVGIPKRIGIHNALEDAKLTAELFYRLIYVKERDKTALFSEFKKYDTHQLYLFDD